MAIAVVWKVSIPVINPYYSQIQCYHTDKRYSYSSKGYNEGSEILISTFSTLDKYCIPYSNQVLYPLQYLKSMSFTLSKNCTLCSI